MIIKTPILYDKDGKVIAYRIQDIPAETIAKLRWNFAYSIKNSKNQFRIPIVGNGEEKDV